MKTTLLFLFFSINIVVGQGSYTIDKDVSIYDVGQNEILTAKQKNNKTHIKHYDNGGNVIWEDSISFSVPVNNSTFRQISRFKGTDDFVFCMSSDLPPYWSLGDIDDTLLFQFTKLNLATHQFTGTFADTMVTKWTRTLDYKDTSIYVFFSDFSIDYSPHNYSTYSLNSDMEFSLVAPSDSVVVQNFLMSIYAPEDEIYKYQTYQEYHFVESYTSQMSLIEHIDYNFTTGMDYNFSNYLSPLNKDSVFVFIEGFTYGGGRDQWRFDWRMLDLSAISSIQINSYTNNTNQNTSGIKTGSGKVKLDKVNRLVMVLGEEEIQSDIYPYTTKNFQSVVIYDYDANFICEVPIWSGNYNSTNSNRLMELSGRVYLQSQGVNDQMLTLIDCNTLGLTESNTEFLNVTIFPNPVEDILNIINHKGVELKIRIQSLDGKVITTISETNSNFKIDLSELVSGVYIVVIESNGEFKTERVIKN